MCCCSSMTDDERQNQLVNCSLFQSFVAVNHSSSLSTARPAQSLLCRGGLAIHTSCYYNSILHNPYHTPRRASSSTCEAAPYKQAPLRNVRRSLFLPDHDRLLDPAYPYRGISYCPWMISSRETGENLLQVKSRPFPSQF